MYHKICEKVSHIFLSKLTILGFFILIFTRFYNFYKPEQKYWDEFYHIRAISFLIDKNDAFYNPVLDKGDEYGNNADFLHPPLSKYMHFLSIKLFGFSSFGWRFLNVLVSIGIGLVGVLFVNYVFGKTQSLIFLFLYTFEGMFITLSHLATTDILFLFFAILSLYFYFLSKQNEKFVYWFFFTISLSIATKWTGVVLLLSLFLIDFGFFKYKNRFLKLFVFIIFIYLFSFLPFFTIFSHSLYDFILLNKNIFTYQLKAHNLSFSSFPLFWIFDQKPILIWYEKNLATNQVFHKIYLFFNPINLIFIVLSFLFFLLKKIKRLKFKYEKEITIFLYLFIINWFFWILPFRDMFLYHFSLPVLVSFIFTSQFLYIIFLKNRFIFIFLMIADIISFIYFFDLWTY